MIKIINSTLIQVQVRSKKDMLRTILFAFNCLACYSGIMFVALREFVDLVKKTENSSVTKNMPYAVIIGNFVNDYTCFISINTDKHFIVYAFICRLLTTIIDFTITRIDKGKFYR